MTPSGQNRFEPEKTSPEFFWKSNLFKQKKLTAVQEGTSVSPETMQYYRKAP